MERKTYKKRIVNEQVDERTGEKIRMSVESEYIPGYVDVKLPDRKRIGNGDFIVMFQNTIMRIVKEAKLSKNEMTLFLYLLGSAGFDNSVCVDLDILVEDLKADKGNISRALKGLIQRNIVIRKDGYRGGDRRTLPMELRINYDQINYSVSWKGDFNEHRKKIGKHPQIIAEPLNMIDGQLHLDFDNTEEKDKEK
jgi:hypothetical protein